MRGLGLARNAVSAETGLIHEPVHVQPPAMKGRVSTPWPLFMPTPPHACSADSPQPGYLFGSSSVASGWVIGYGRVALLIRYA